MKRKTSKPRAKLDVDKVHRALDECSVLFRRWRGIIDGDKESAEGWAKTFERETKFAEVNVNRALLEVEHEMDRRDPRRPGRVPF